MKKIRPLLLGLCLALVLCLGISTVIMAAEPSGEGDANANSWGQCSEGAGPGLNNNWGKDAH